MRVAPRRRSWGWFLLLGTMWGTVTLAKAGSLWGLVFLCLPVLYVGMWWALGPPVVVLWWPFNLEPTVYYNPTSANSPQYLRAVLFAQAWSKVGGFPFLLKLIRLRYRWALYVDICREVVQRRQACGEFYDVTPEGRRVSIGLTEVEWLSDTWPAYLLGRTVKDCYDAIKRV